MKHILLTLFFITLTFSLVLAEDAKPKEEKPKSEVASKTEEKPVGGEKPKGEEKPKSDEKPKSEEKPKSDEKTKSEEKPKSDEKTKSEEKPKSDEKPKDGPINISDMCKNVTSIPACEATLKELGADQQGMKVNKFAQKVIRHAQTEFGHTSTKARETMREDALPMKIKKSLSHCVKMYLDIADELRGLYLSSKSRKFSAEGTQFIHMAKNFPRHCEDGLKKAGTTGEKLKLYKSYSDLEDLASTVDAVIRYASACKKAGGKQ